MKTAEEMSNLFEEIKNEKETKVIKALEARQQETIRYCDEELEALLINEIKNNLSRSLWMNYEYRIDELSNFCLAIDEDFEPGEVNEIDLVTLESYLRCSGYGVASQVYGDEMKVYIKY